MRRGRWLALVVALLAGPAAPATDLEPAERLAYAGFVYNFAWYTTWPTNVWQTTSNTLVIGVLGDPQLAEVFARQLNGKQVEGRPVTVRLLPPDWHEAPLQILFVSRQATNHWQQIRSQLKKQSVLTLSDAPQFTQQGGMVQLTNVNSRVTFQVDLVSVRQADLNISARLLRLAVKVNQRSDNGEEVVP